MSRRTDAAMAGAGKFATGTYVGDGNLTQAIVGVGFRPKHVVVWRREGWLDANPFWKTDVDGLFALCQENSWVRWGYRDDMIISLDADGFTVGDGTGAPFNFCNVFGAQYAFACWG